MAAVGTYVVFDDVNYISRGWINRNNIFLNGKPHMFALSLLGASQNKKFNEIEILDDPKNRTNILRLIGDAYRKAPHFADVFPVIESLMNYSESNIAKFFAHQIAVVLGYLGLRPAYEASSKNHSPTPDNPAENCGVSRGGGNWRV
jgi:hypothetical protein